MLIPQGEGDREGGDETQEEGRERMLQPACGYASPSLSVFLVMAAEQNPNYSY